MAVDLINELDGLLAAFDRNGLEYAVGGWPAFTIYRLPRGSNRIEIFVLNEGSSDARHAVASSPLELDVLVTSRHSAIWNDRVRAVWRRRAVVLAPRECLAPRWFAEAPLRPKQRPSRAQVTLSEELVSQRLEMVRALYHLERSLREARVIGPLQSKTYVSA